MAFRHGAKGGRTTPLEGPSIEADKLLSFALGPMKVRVIGDAALAQASVMGKRIHDGKDMSGEFVFMGLLKKRAGKWMVVRTLGARAD